LFELCRSRYVDPKVILGAGGIKYVIDFGIMEAKIKSQENKAKLLAC
jgi:hypothetical protein